MDARDPKASTAASRRSFAQGVTAGLPILAGYVPVAIAFGLLARDQALGVGIATASSALVFAGASQFIALQLLASGASAAQIIITTLLVNFRHFLMSGSLAEKLRLTKLRPLIAFGVTDETFAVASSARAPNRPFMLGLELTAYLAWVLGTALGYQAGALLPAVVQAGFGILLYALFISMLVPQSIDHPEYALVALIAAAINTLLLFVGVESSGIRVLLAIVGGAAGGMVLPERRRS
jgi:4-azaleucine resistance transporter AzlC